MKYFTLIFAVLFSLTSVNAFASGYTCKAINGHIAQLTPDPACTILNDQASHFPNVTFDGFPNCFKGNLTATLGTSNVTGTSYSGLTMNGLGQLTAASAINLIGANPPNVNFGRIFTFDTVLVNNNTIIGEELALTDGTKTYNDAHGNLEINGDALNTPSGADFSGVICTEK